MQNRIGQSVSFLRFLSEGRDTLINVPYVPNGSETRMKRWFSMTKRFLACFWYIIHASNLWMFLFNDKQFMLPICELFCLKVNN